jgi:hypothetical protein
MVGSNWLPPVRQDSFFFVSTAPAVAGRGRKQTPAAAGRNAHCGGPHMQRDPLERELRVLVNVSCALSSTGKRELRRKKNARANVSAHVRNHLLQGKDVFPDRLQKSGNQLSQGKAPLNK